MTARINIFALMLGLAILTIATVPSAFRAALTVAHDVHTSHDHHSKHVVNGAAGSSQPKQAMVHSPSQSHDGPAHDGLGHDGHGSKQSCWEHCADILATTLRASATRTRDHTPLSGAFPAPDTYALTSIAFPSLPPNGRLKPAGLFHDHGTGVSWILRTNMRIRT